MNKRVHVIIICIALLFTGFFAWIFFSASSDNSKDNLNNSSNVNQNTQNSTTTQKNNESATIIDNNNKGTSNQSSPNINESKKDSPDSAQNNPKTSEQVSESDKSKATNATLVPEEASKNFTVYEVKKDDTLASICKQFFQSAPNKVATKAILNANNLSSNSEITPGLKIKLPSKYANGIKYTVIEGDSLYSIASAHMEEENVYQAIEKIKKDNFLASDTIKSGDELFLADVTNSSSPSTASNTVKSSVNSEASSSVENAEKASKKNFINYTVKKNDTLASITKQYEKYCPPVIAGKTILKINKLSSSNEIKEGIVIRIPESYLTEGERYTVQFGDSLSQIVVSHMKGIEMHKAIEKIAKDNFKTNQNIRTGEELFIAATELEM